VRHFSQIGGVYQRVQPGARLWHAPYQAAEKDAIPFVIPSEAGNLSFFSSVKSKRDSSLRSE
jgi:hypothetical protein